VGVAGRLTRDFRAGRVYAAAPSFLGRPITSNLFVERTSEQFGSTASQTEPRFIVDTTDLTFEQRVRPFPATEIAYRYTLERNHTFDQHPDPNEPLPFDVAVTTSRLASTLIVDRRDDLVDSTRGWFHSSDVQYAPEALKSDIRFAKYLLQQRYYRRAGRIVFATQARVGVATAFDQSLVPKYRFFAGGGNSVRGYADDVLSPRDLLGDVIGGRGLLVLNQEVRFPVYSILRGVGFFDAGRAFESPGAIRLRDLSAGAGVGARIQTPVVMLRIDLGFPFDTATGPRRARWFISVGQLF
jgi:outer membrane protein assembly factor BamA